MMLESDSTAGRYRSQGSMLKVPPHAGQQTSWSRPSLESLGLAAAREVGATGGGAVHPVFGRLISHQPAIAALQAVAGNRPLPGGASSALNSAVTFTDGYVISKPPGAPPLFWHYGK